MQFDRRLTSLAALLAAGLFLAGCASSKPAVIRPSSDRTGSARGVPAEAQVVAEGTPPLSFLYSGHGGTLYVYDQTADALIHTADFGPDRSTTGAIVKIDPDQRALVMDDANKNSVTLGSIDPKHRFTMWFMPPVPPGGEKGAGKGP